MLQIIQSEFFTCKICKSKYTEKNYPVSLNCGETLCFNCNEKMLNNNEPCPFDKSHQHSKENTVKNICLLSIGDDIMKLIKVNKKKYDKELLEYLNELKKKSKKIKKDNQNEQIISQSVNNKV